MAHGSSSATPNAAATRAAGSDWSRSPCDSTRGLARYLAYSAVRGGLHCRNCPWQRGALGVAVCVWQRSSPPPLEVFQTASKGWGVRAAEAIPKGTFVCSYLGEVVFSCDIVMHCVACGPHQLLAPNEHAGPQRQRRRAAQEPTARWTNGSSRRVLRRDSGAAPSSPIGTCLSMHMGWSVT